MKFINTIKIGTFFRTRVRIHYTWILVFILIPWTVSTQYSTETSLLSRVGFGLITAFLYFGTVFFREIVLLMLAVYKGMVIRTVTIFAFGGLIQPDYETTSPSHEILLAVSGMLLNFVITAIFFFTHPLFGDIDLDMKVITVKWLAFFYFTLSLFHLLPAYPLEGGRILRGIIWKVTGNVRQATRIVGITGWILGFLTMVGGILLAVLTEELFTGLFFIGLGLIIQNAATHGIRHLKQIPELPPPGPPSLPPEEVDQAILLPSEEIPTQQPQELPSEEYHQLRLQLYTPSYRSSTWPRTT
jgi:Zn-dependent protease